MTVKAALPSCRVQAEVAVPPDRMVLVDELVTPLTSPPVLYTPTCVLPADAFTMAEPGVVLPLPVVFTSNPPPVLTMFAPVMVLVVPFMEMVPAVMVPVPTVVLPLRVLVWPV